MENRSTSKFTTLTSKLRPITLRSVVIGLVCVIFICLITPYNDYYIRGTFAAGNHFPIGSFFLFTALTLIAIGLRLLKSRWELTGTELITIWCMMLVASGIPSSGFIRYHLFMLASPLYYANPENDWKALFFHHLPDAIVIKDPLAVKYFYEELPPGESVPWGVWIKPACIWSIYVLLTYTICRFKCIYFWNQPGVSRGFLWLMKVATPRVNQLSPSKPKTRWAFSQKGRSTSVI